ncbi:MAG: DNA-binding response regulator [Desulfuromonas sp.]|nr:MAG: DNA-binding response regulator [Desulfuromonas sp.]
MELTARILIIDDERDNREALTLLLRGQGYDVHDVGTAEAALSLLKKGAFDVIITDLFLPGLSGIDLLKRVKSNAPGTDVILITGHASAETAVEAMKEGAFDYVTKPFNFDKLKIIISKALEKGRLLAENSYLKQQLRGKYKFERIIGNSPAMQQVFSRMEKIVDTDSTILILGESGTGKELVAKAIHFNGPRKDKPFVAINCGAIPAELLESELFGHMRGAFTGAVADKPGKFELAHTGTIFLDEIGTMPMHLQMKLLRVLQEHEVERVGSSRRVKLNVRVISATNANLDEQVRKGVFRDDLYYRLNVIPIHLPPLRDRSSDIPLLTRHFLSRICEEMNRPLKSFSVAALRALEAHDWPGNVREMENVIERSVTLTDSQQIDRQDLPPEISGKAPAPAPLPLHLDEEGVDLPAIVAELERQMISEALTRTEGVKAKAALLLGLNRTTLVEKIKRLGLTS